MPRQRELASDFGSDYRLGDRTLWRRRPQTAIQALMECSPGQEPDLSKDELMGLRDVVEDAIQALEPLQRFVFNEVVVAKRSLRHWEPVLPKTTVARLRDNAIRTLRDALEGHPLITDYLERGNT